MANLECPQSCDPWTERSTKTHSTNRQPLNFWGITWVNICYFHPWGWWTFDEYVSKGLVQPPTGSIFSRTNKPFKLLFHGPLAESASQLFGYFWSIISAVWSFHTDFKSHSFEMFGDFVWVLWQSKLLFQNFRETIFTVYVHSPGGHWHPGWEDNPTNQWLFLVPLNRW